jgi:hypothetical protein
MSRNAYAESVDSTSLDGISPATILQNKQSSDMNADPTGGDQGVLR